MTNNVKIALASPKIRLGDAEHNARICADAAREADGVGADIIAFPELALTGATCGDLYFQHALTDYAEDALEKYIENTAELDVLSFIGLPIRIGADVYDAVAAVSGGELLGISVGGDGRQFSPLPATRLRTTVAGRTVIVGSDLVFSCEGDTRVKIFVKIGKERCHVPADADIVINPIAEAEYLGLSAERRKACELESARLGVVYALVGAGIGESGTDGIYASPRIIASAGKALAESPLFSEELLITDVDASSARQVNYTAKMTDDGGKFPFISGDESDLALALEMQSRALAARLERSYSSTAVIGVSGGLDSTLAVLVCAYAMDLLGRDRKSVIAITMPCFGTTERTKGNALALAEELGCTVRTIDIKAAVAQHFSDIGHDSGNYDVVYENAQARERTQILMDVANAERGLVVGTGDLSELALGFATYNGDHMSMYCVNGSVPKTLMRAIINYAAERAETEGNSRLATVLLDVINTPVSPELLPTDGAENNQHTEKIVGPYELHDFFLYHTVVSGVRPDRLLELAVSVFPEYDHGEIRGYLDIFIRRFISQQFKRSCMPDGPRVTKISLSPRGAWSMPSDISGAAWKKYLG